MNKKKETKNKIYFKTKKGKLLCGDSMSLLKEFPDNYFSACITDPPYGLSNITPDKVKNVLKEWLSGNEDFVPHGKGFMGKEWDKFVPPPALWKEVYRVMKPGATIFVFAGTRTYDLMTISLRLAGFEIKDTLMWLYDCVSEDTEILTEKGWKKWDELKEGEKVYTLNLSTERIEKDIALEKFVYDVNDIMYEIGESGQLVTKDHKVVFGIYDRFFNVWKLKWDLAKNLQKYKKIQYIGIPIIKEEDLREITRKKLPYRSMFLIDVTEDIKKVKYKGKVWSIRTNNMTYIARRNGKIFITGNSGFPKAQDISKMIDKMFGVERKIIGRNPNSRENCTKENTLYRSGTVGKTDYITIPASPEAKLWNGHKTHSLKPAYEPIIMAMKPNEGSYANNALKWGVAGLNVDEGRIEGKWRGTTRINSPHTKNVYGDYKQICSQQHPNGRFPANILLDEEVAKLLDEQAPNTGAYAPVKKGHSGKSKGIYGDYKQRGDDGLTFYNDGLKGASRFFYVAKASKKERNSFGEMYRLKKDVPENIKREIEKYLTMLDKKVSYKYEKEEI